LTNSSETEFSVHYQGVIFCGSFKKRITVKIPMLIYDGVQAYMVIHGENTLFYCYYYFIWCWNM